MNPNQFKTQIRGDVYVLKLEHECFYIGFTKNIDRRIADHFKGKGAIWTQLHEPISVLKVFPDKTLNFENELTERAIKRYGFSFVLGGDHIYFLAKYG